MDQIGSGVRRVIWRDSFGSARRALHLTAPSRMMCGNELFQYPNPAKYPETNGTVNPNPTIEPPSPPLGEMLLTREGAAASNLLITEHT